jgi:hypothetical protein
MTSITSSNPNLQAEGPTLEVHFLISRELEAFYKKSGQEMPPPIIVKALIDTGASNCSVQEDIPRKLGLQPVGTTGVLTPSTKGTPHLCYTYFMRMLIPSHNIIYEGIFTAVQLDGQNISCLIGRDLLAFSIFIYQGTLKQFTFTLG